MRDWWRRCGFGSSRVRERGRKKRLLSLPFPPPISLKSRGIPDIHTSHKLQNAPVSPPHPLSRIAVLPSLFEYKNRCRSAHPHTAKTISNNVLRPPLCSGTKVAYRNMLSRDIQSLGDPLLVGVAHAPPAPYCLFGQHTRHAFPCLTSPVRKMRHVHPYQQSNEVQLRWYISVRRSRSYAPWLRWL